jgi:hypothetical protein
MTPADLVVLHEITQLKYRYMRGVDTQDPALLETVFAPDVRCWYDGGKHARTGRAEVIAFLKAGIGPTVYSTHIAIHPEITLTSPTTATGVWRFQDIVYFSGPHPELVMPGIQGGEELVGAGYYHDEYVKLAEGWRIKSTGYVRIFQAVKRPYKPNEIELTTEPMRGKLAKT